MYFLTNVEFVKGEINRLSNNNVKFITKKHFYIKEINQPNTNFLTLKCDIYFKINSIHFHPPQSSFFSVLWLQFKLEIMNILNLDTDWMLSPYVIFILNSDKNLHCSTTDSHFKNMLNCSLAEDQYPSWLLVSLWLTHPFSGSVAQNTTYFYKNRNETSVLRGSKQIY